MRRRRAPTAKANHELVSVALPVDHWKLICATLTDAATQLCTAKTEGFANLARNEIRRQLCGIRDEIKNDVGLEDA